MNNVVENDAITRKGYTVLSLKPDQLYTFDEGLPGFEKITQYALLVQEAELPFCHLSAVGGFNLEFVVVSPWQIIPEYKPEVSSEDLLSIGSPESADLIVLAIVCVGEPFTESTANFAAPIVINAKTGKGKQIVVRNIEQYSSKYNICQQEAK